MIQRIQSVWLLLAATASFLTLKFSFYSGNIIKEGQPKTFSKLVATDNILLTITTVATGLLALVAIFLYKNRKLQTRLCLISLLLSGLNLVLFYIQIKKFVPLEGSYDLTAAIAIAVPVLIIFAIRGVNRDQKLVKSLDRLR
jgi:peptidoglycan/LPS O-acetylase OafA/YrhL